MKPSLYYKPPIREPIRGLELSPLPLTFGLKVFWRVLVVLSTVVMVAGIIQITRWLL